MTHPALTAAVTAAREFADAMEKAHAAFNAPEYPTEVKVGYTATTKAAALALLGRLPEGAEVTDRDGDVWTKADTGFRFRSGSYADNTAASAAEYAPLTVTSLPETEQEIKVGDTVIIREGFVGGVTSLVVGRTGKVQTIDVGHGRTRYTVDGCTAARVELVDPAPVADPDIPDRVEIVTTDDDARRIGAEPGIPGDGSAYLWATSYGARTSLWLSRDEARRLAATLTAIADTP